MRAKLLPWSVYSIATLFVVLFLALAIMRLVYPYEVEWMEGSMLEHSVRILESKPIYTAPTVDFVAWLYPPLYYYAVAIAMKVFGIGFFAARFVSIVSTLLSTRILFLIVRSITGRTALAALTAALFVATYHVTGFYFDIARNDAFFVLLLLCSAFVAIRIQGLAGAISSAALLSLAFLTKQQALFFFPAIGIWFWIKSRRLGVVFSLSALFLTLTTLFISNSSSNEWLFYYLFKIPSAKTADFSILRALAIFPRYIFGAFAFSTLGLIALLYQKRDSLKAAFDSATVLLILCTFSGFIAGAMSLGNEGGDANVLIPFAAFIVAMIPIAMHQLPKRYQNIGWGVLLFQFVALYFNPLSEKMLIASAHQKAGGDAFMQKLEALPGDVFIPYHSFIGRQAGKPTHANILAFIDVLRTQDSSARRIQADLDSAFAQHRFQAVIMEECPLIRVDSVNHYALKGRMLTEDNVFLTRFGPDATRPQYLYVPK